MAALPDQPPITLLRHPIFERWYICRPTQDRSRCNAILTIKAFQKRLLLYYIFFQIEVKAPIYHVISSRKEKKEQERIDFLDLLAHLHASITRSHY